jgi:hypothetical protein
MINRAFAFFSRYPESLTGKGKPKSTACPGRSATCNVALLNWDAASAAHHCALRRARGTPKMMGRFSSHLFPVRL